MSQQWISPEDGSSLQPAPVIATPSLAGAPVAPRTVPEDGFRRRFQSSAGGVQQSRTFCTLSQHAKTSTPTGAWVAEKCGFLGQKPFPQHPCHRENFLSNLVKTFKIRSQKVREKNIPIIKSSPRNFQDQHKESEFCR